MLTYHCEYAWVDGAVARSVAITVHEGRIVAVTPDAPAADATRLPGLVLPGFANAHSHAFHRALRGRAQTGGGTFWTWREQMYDLAGRIDPDQYHALARAVYAEMVLAGITCVGEFHYLHHAPRGIRYADANEVGHRLLAAAAEAGLRITLLDTLYLSSTVEGAPLTGTQLRFGDGSLQGWAERRAAIRPAPHAVIGAAAHSVRAAPDCLGSFASRTAGTPTHIHLSEQPAENEACLARYGTTPAGVLDLFGLRGPWVTVVHGTHLTERDITSLGAAGTRTCLCPTTERDLGDGIGPARALADAGSPLCLGSDSHALIDPIEEARAIELDERLRAGSRGHFTTAELLTAATLGGHAALGWPDAGSLAVGQRADLVAVRLDTVRTAGFDDPAASVLYGATAGDVTDVVIDGRPVVRDGVHLLVPDVAGALDAAIRAVWA